MCLSGYIPLYPSLEGSCLITFSNLRLRDCMITLDHKQIMNSLSSGVNTNLDLKLRNYIIYPCDNREEIYYVDLANTRIPLERKEVEQLIEIIDDFFNCYIEECRQLYFLLSRDKFDRSDESNQIRLITISKQLWFNILRFTREFDYSNGNSDWNIFDSGSSFIKIYYKHEGEFKAFIFPEIKGRKYMIPDNEDIVLVWTEEFFMHRKIDNFKNNKIWSSIYTYNWLINELIPYVIYYYSTNDTRLFKKKISYDDFKKEFNIKDFVHVSLYCNDNEKNILDFISEIQLFYSTYHDDYYCASDLIGLYKSLKVTIEKSDIDSYGLEYMMRKLDINTIINKTDILDYLDRKIQNINSGKVVSSFTVDNIFRCIVISFRDYNNNLSDKDIFLLKKKLNIFNEKRIINNICRKF